MSPVAEQLLKQVLTLGEQDRASLAGALIESLHGPADVDAEDAWDMEIKRRTEELDSGAVKGVPWPDVRARLFHGFE
ncbi:MAG TPA: addiction module protein [Thermoanaerobaculia bacterium]|jgi:putative addiction module component (TIGR02574 family)|nr:addiction module protein [Thermoanaerobaculia bacterium]